jgi:hypothetical protein
VPPNSLAAAVAGERRKGIAAISQFNGEESEG